MSTRERLSNATVSRLPAWVQRPVYDRTALKPGIVHLGIGAFHRAHQAVYIDELVKSDSRWGIVGASLRSASVHEQMAPQDCLYTVTEFQGDEQATRLIGCVKDVIVATQERDRLLATMADPDVHLVSLTVTEKGYKLDAGGALLLSDPDIINDIEAPGMPRSALGFIVAALARRRERGSKPFTVLSCDNLRENGHSAKRAVLSLAAEVDPFLRDWIDEFGAFPNTMVDRIVPATTSSDIERLRTQIGVEDQAMVKTEPFSQWVVEDRFASERPQFEMAGVQLTDDVAPWEEAKLRLLNGAHSAIAYCGALSGADFVHQAVDRRPLRGLVERLWDETQTTFVPPKGFELPAYRAALMRRFQNGSLNHSTRQIAMDGSQKLPQRLLAPIAARLRNGQSVDALSFAVAAWVRWQRGVDEDGASYVVEDPLASVTGAAWSAETVEGVLDDILKCARIFDPALAADGRFRGPVQRHLTFILEHGISAALEQVAGSRTA